MGQIGYIVLFFAKFGINCLNIKSDVPVNTFCTNQLLKEMLILYINRPR